jgi:uncharacterized phiE125 gp8 family phage protein
MNDFPRRLTQPATEPFTLQEALTHLREVPDGGANDAYILQLIKVARQACEERTERTLITSTWRTTLDGFPDAVRLLMPPIVSVQSVSFRDPLGAFVVLDPGDYAVDTASEPGYLVPAYSSAWPETRNQINSVVIDYTAGYGSAADIPFPLQQWMLLAIGDMYENRNATNIGNITTPFDFADNLIYPFRVLGL